MFVQIGNGQNKSNYLVDEYGNPMHYSVANKFSKCNVFLVVDSGTKQVTPFEYLNNSPLGNIVLLKGAKTIELETRIQKDSLKFYRYSIVKNDIVIKKDATLEKVKYKWANGSILPNYVAVDLGVFNVVNKKIEVQIFRVDKKKRTSSVIIYNKPLVPPSLLSFEVLGNNSAKKINNNANLIVDEKFKGLRVSMKNTDINILYTLIMQSNSGRDVQLLEPKWKAVLGQDLVVADINAENFTKSGNYKISVYPKTQTYAFWKDNSLAKDFHFSVRKTKIKLFSGREIALIGLSIAAVLGGIFGAIAIYMRKKAAKKLAAQSKQKEIAQLQLNSVRSQLNPHFLFNALAGIQNLMNKNEIDNANRYLTKFARLTRNVLDSKELISLTEEKTLLDDYLQMEQLRFGFQYAINASADLDTENIEIPAMLLQPFVENAVKHGIAEKGSYGEITVNFERQVSNLVLKITDNGKGFDTTQTCSGLGLALSKNRISLLNTIYKDTPFVLNIQSDTSGTTVTITLTQWL